LIIKNNRSESAGSQVDDLKTIKKAKLHLDIYAENRVFI